MDIAPYFSKWTYANKKIQITIVQLCSGQIQGINAHLSISWINLVTYPPTRSPHMTASEQIWSQSLLYCFLMPSAVLAVLSISISFGSPILQLENWFISLWLFK